MYMSFIAVTLAGCGVFPLSHPEPPVSKQQDKNPEHPQLPDGQVLPRQTVTRGDGLLYLIDAKQPWTGKVVEFHPNDQKAFEKQYHDGRLEGYSVWWTEQGKIQHQRTYRNGRLHGSWVQWTTMGIPKQEQVYENGAEIYRRGWWPNGQVHFIAWMQGGVEAGRKVWAEDGEIAQVTGSIPEKPLPPRPRLDSGYPHVAPESPRVHAPENRAKKPTKKAHATWAQLEKRGDNYYLKGEKVPYSGTAAMAAPDGKRRWIIEFSLGKLISIGESKIPKDPK